MSEAASSSPDRSGASSVTQPNRRERRKAETRRRLLRAARALFVELGYDATRPQDIARAADVAIGTFYLHFPDKRAAFLAFTDEAAQELMESVRASTRASSTFEERLYAAFEALLVYSDENPGVLRAAFADEAVIAAGAAQGGSLRERLAQNLARGLRQGMLRGSLQRDYDPLLIAHAIVGLVQQAIVYGHDRLERRELLGNITRFCSRALTLREPESASAPALEEETRS